MRIFEIDSRIKARIKKAIDKLDDSNPEDMKMLDYLKNNLFTKNLHSTLDTSDLHARVRGPAYEWFVSKLETLKVPLEHKVHLLKLMADPSNLIPASTFQNNLSGNILSYLGSRIKNNLAFKELVEPAWRFKIGGQGGMGPGEMFLILFSENGKEGSTKKGGDLEVGGGWTVELKNGGVIPPGDTGKRIVDSLNKNLLDIARTEGFFNQLNLKSGPNFDGGWIPEFFKTYASIKGDAASKAEFSKYLNSLYEGIPPALVAQAYDNLGNPGTAKIIAPYIFEMYQKSHGWNSICLVDNDFKFINLVSFNTLPPEVKVTIKLKRGKGDVDDIQAGGDTNAVADGYALVGMGKAQVEKAAPTAKIKAPKDAEKKQKTLNPELFSEPATAPAPAPKPAATVPSPARFKDTMKDPNNPITMALRSVSPKQKTWATERIQDMMNAGSSDEEIAAEISNDMYQESLTRLKTLIKH